MHSHLTSLKTTTYNHYRGRDIEVNNHTNACEYPPMLDDYIFLSFIAFMIWGPMVEEKHQLHVPLFVLTDPPKENVLSRKQ